MLSTLVAFPALLAFLACTGSQSPPGADGGGGDGGASPGDSAGVDGGSVVDSGAGDGGTVGDGGSGVIPCVETVVPLSKGKAPVSVDEVWPVIEAWIPRSMTWLWTPVDDAKGTTVSFSVAFEQSGDPAVVTRTGTDPDVATHPTACRPGPELRIPVTATVTVDGDYIQARHVGYVDALAAERTRIYFTRLEAEAPTLSAAAQKAADAVLAENGRTLDDATRIYARMITSQTDNVWAPEWALEVIREEAPMWGLVLWHGSIEE